MDVPQGHWSYDAVGLLASRGIVSGYPDGAFKGAQPATRYEMASVVARALVTVDAEKASKQDLELLKKLVMEFKDELDALGVKVDALDKRVAVLEDRLGGWKFNGQFWFDAKFASDDDNGQNSYNTNGDNQFGFAYARLMVTKYLDENKLLLHASALERRQRRPHQLACGPLLRQHAAAVGCSHDGRSYPARLGRAMPTCTTA